MTVPRSCSISPATTGCGQWVTNAAPHRINRHKDSGEETRRLHERLALRYGEGLVWCDKDDLALGANWLDEIHKAIAAADAVVVVIGPQWLAKTRGRSRLHDAEDVLRREIEWALGGRERTRPRPLCR